MKTYTIAELNSIASLAEIKGPTKTGSTGSVKFKTVNLVESEPYDHAIVATYGSASPVVICEPAKRSQFIHRGC